MIILSIDSGLERTGYAVIDKSEEFKTGFKIITSGRIHTSKKLDISARLKQIYLEVKRIISKYKVTRLVMERLFFFKNQKTIVPVSQAQGVILLLAGQNEIPFSFLTPLQIKEIITGYGQADKKAVQKMLKLTLGITLPSTHDDEADAIACGLAYCYLNKNTLK